MIGGKVSVYREGWRSRFFGWLRWRSGLDEGAMLGPGLYAVAMILWPARMFGALRSCDYRPDRDAYNLEGLWYSRQIFQSWATDELPTKWCRFVSREGGYLHVESLNMRLDALDVKDNSILVVKTAYPGDLPSCDQWQNVLKELPQVKSIMCLEPDWDIACLDEADMRAAGWIRVEQKEAKETKGEA